MRTVGRNGENFQIFENLANNVELIAQVEGVIPKMRKATNFFETWRLQDISRQASASCDACQQHFLYLALPPSLLSLLPKLMEEGVQRAGARPAWSIYLISSISRLIFSPGPTEGERRDWDGGRKGREAAVEEEGEKEESRTTGRPTEMLGRGRCVGVGNAPFSPFLPPPLHRRAPPRSPLFRPTFLHPPAECGRGTTSVAAWLTASQDAPPPK